MRPSLFGTTVNKVSTPPIPTFNNIASWVSTFNWNPGDYTGAAMTVGGSGSGPFAISGTDLYFLNSTPYPTDWESFIAESGPTVDVWYDQNGFAQLDQTDRKPIANLTEKVISFNGNAILASFEEVSGPYTMYFWYNANVAPTQLGGVYSFNGVTYAENGLIASIDTNGKLQITGSANGHYRRLVSAALMPSGWHLLAISYDPSAAPVDQIVASLDNVPVTFTVTINNDLSLYTSEPGYVTLGGTYAAGNFYPSFNGDIRLFGVRYGGANDDYNAAVWDYVQYLQSISPA